MRGGMGRLVSSVLQMCEPITVYFPFSKKKLCICNHAGLGYLDIMCKFASPLKQEQIEL